MCAFLCRNYVRSFAEIDQVIAKCQQSSCLAVRESFLPAVQIQSTNKQRLLDEIKKFPNAAQLSFGKSILPMVTNLCVLVQSHINAVLQWHEDLMQMQFLESTTLLVASNLEMLERQEAYNSKESNLRKLNISVNMIQQDSTWLQALENAYTQKKQLSYHVIQGPAPLSLPHMPSSVALQGFQDSCDGIESDFEQRTNTSVCWTEFKASPATVQELLSNGTAMINVPLPSNGTRFYNIRLVTWQAVRVLLMHPSLEDFSMEVARFGRSFILDQHLDRFDYQVPTHKFTYVSGQSTQDTVDDIQIRPSPYGLWSLSLLSPDLPALQGLIELSLQFLVTFEQQSESSGGAMFGGASGRLCFVPKHPKIPAKTPTSRSTAFPTFVPTNAAYA